MSFLDYQVLVRQQPIAARACGSADRPDRRPIDPIVILQLLQNQETELHTDEKTLSFFCVATLIENPSSTTDSAQGQNHAPVASSLLTGTILSSIYHLRDPERGGKTAAFFVFPDLNIRSDGNYSLRFDVFGLQEDRFYPLAYCISSIFTVYSAKRFPGMTNSTELSKTFSDQGLKIRIRKDIRMRKKPRVDSGESQNRIRDDSTVTHVEDPVQQDDHPSPEQNVSSLPAPSTAIRDRLHGINNSQESTRAIVEPRVYQHDIDHAYQQYLQNHTQYPNAPPPPMHDQLHHIGTPAAPVLQAQVERQVAAPYNLINQRLLLSSDAPRNRLHSLGSTSTSFGSDYCSERTSELPYELPRTTLFSSNPAYLSKESELPGPRGTGFEEHGARKEEECQLPSFSDTFPAYDRRRPPPLSFPGAAPHPHQQIPPTLSLPPSPPFPRYPAQDPT